METAHIISINGTDFLLDKEGWIKFILEFDDNNWKNIISNGYFARINDSKYIQYFHRWLLRKEVKQFAEKNNLTVKSIEIDHLNGKRNDDRKINLQVESIEHHRERHEVLENARRQKAWITFRDNPKNIGIELKYLRKRFDRWYDSKNNEGKDRYDQEQEEIKKDIIEY